MSTGGAKGLDLAGTALGTGSVFDSTSRSRGSAVGAVSLVDTTGSIALGDGLRVDLSLTSLTGLHRGVPPRNAGTVTVPAGGASQRQRPPAARRSTSGTTAARASRSTTRDSTNSTGNGINLVGPRDRHLRRRLGQLRSPTPRRRCPSTRRRQRCGRLRRHHHRRRRRLAPRQTAPPAASRHFNGAITDGDGDGGGSAVLVTNNTGSDRRASTTAWSCARPPSRRSPRPAAAPSTVPSSCPARTRSRHDRHTTHRLGHHHRQRRGLTFRTHRVQRRRERHRAEQDRRAGRLDRDRLRRHVHRGGAAAAPAGPPGFDRGRGAPSPCGRRRPDPRHAHRPDGRDDGIRATTVNDVDLTDAS